MKSLDNNDQDQVVPAIRKTSCGLAHYYVPQYSAQKRSEEPFFHASVAELWRFKQLSESLLNEKNGMFFSESIHDFAVIIL